MQHGHRGSWGALFVLVASTIGGPAAAEPPILWEGFYIGGQGGHSFESGGLDVTSDSTLTIMRGGRDSPAFPKIFEDRATASDEDDGGAIGGILVGYNKQLGRVVLGVEADLNWSDIGLGSASVATFAPRVFGPEPDFAAGSTSANAEVEWYGTLRGRLGLAYGPLLPYLTAGLAFGQIDLTGTVNLQALFDDDVGLRRASASLNDTFDKVGWTAGGGFDYAFSPKIILGVSYQYVDLGDVSERRNLFEYRNVGAAGFDRADVDGSAKVDASFQTVMARLSFKFGGYDYAPSEPLK
jgi:outer membrane immunogenic protein